MSPGGSQVGRCPEIFPGAEVTAKHSRKWLTWLVGIACLAGVMIVATHFTEEENIFQLARQVKLSWLAVALILQVGTYIVQGEIWCSVGHRAGHPLHRLLVYKLALAKLFIDQALPSAGMSGTVVVAQALETESLPHAAVLAGVVINGTSFLMTYVVALAAALVVLFYSGQVRLWIVAISILFMLLGIVLSYGLVKFAGRELARVPKRLRRYRMIQNALDVLKDADGRLVRNVRLQVIASTYQMLTFALDAATLWVLIHSLSAAISLPQVFASFMIANLMRSVSFIPGGLGTFEGAVVWMLRGSGVSVAVGLSAALLFRGTTFFLPMIPGLWFSRHVAKKN